MASLLDHNDDQEYLPAAPIDESTIFLARDQKNPAVYETQADGTETLTYPASPARANDSFHFSMKELYLARIRSFAAAAKLIIAQETGEQLDPTDQRVRGINQLVADQEAALARIQDGNHLTNNTYTYEIYNFSKALAKAAGYKFKHIALAESLRVWQKVERPTRVTQFKIQRNGKKFIVIQKDTPAKTQLTDVQKGELRRVHTDNPPKWFKELPEFAQNYLKKIVPTAEQEQDLSDQDAWANYQKPLPTTLRRIPGEANASIHEFIIIDDATGAEVSHTRSRRQGVPSAYDISDKEERQQSAIQNVAQMLDGELGEDEDGQDARARMLAAWGIQEDVQNLECPVLLGGLVTAWDQAHLGYIAAEALGFTGKDHNERMTREKAAAADSYRRDGYKIFNLNVVINKFRSGHLTPDIAFIKFAQDFIRKIAPHTPDQARLRKLKAAVSTLIALANNSQEVDGRNRNLYIAALYDVTTRLMGGVSTGNCKSSKDRKGTEQLYADAIELYYSLYGKFPSLFDKGKDRENFVTILCEVYASGHQLLMAHDNSPGSLGIKDEDGGLIDDDIAAKLTAMGIFQQSREMADLNKPGTLWHKHKSKFLLVVAAVAAIPTAIFIILAGLAAVSNPITSAFIFTTAIGFGIAALGMAILKLFGSTLNPSLKKKIEKAIMAVAGLTSGTLFVLAVIVAVTNPLVLFALTGWTVPLIGSIAIYKKVAEPTMRASEELTFANAEAQQKVAMGAEPEGQGYVAILGGDVGLGHEHEVDHDALEEPEQPLLDGDDADPDHPQLTAADHFKLDADGDQAILQEGGGDAPRPE